VNQVNSIAAVAEIRPALLAGLADAELRAIVAASIVRKFRAREVMIHQETPAKHLYLLISGRARYFFVTRQGRKVLLRWLIVGDIAGAAALLQGNVSHLIGTEMVRDGLALSWDRTTMGQLTTRYPSLLRNALSVIIGYLDWYLTDHVALTYESAGQRVAAILDRLATTIGSSYPEGIGVDVTNEELANAANVTPFTVSRLLNKWQSSGVLVKRRGTIVVTSVKRFSQAR
jgi:CRP-like cAMP-binding protein